MKKRSGITLGPGASSLILIFVVLALSVLALLSLMNARSDLSLSERSAQVAQAAAEFQVKMEEKRAALDGILAQAAEKAQDDSAYLSVVAAALPEEMAMYDREISWLELDSWEGANGLRQMNCAVELLPLGSSPRVRWLRHDMEAVTEDTVTVLNARAERKRLALEEILQEAARTAADEEAYLASVAQALPGDMTLSDGFVTFVETSAGTETDAPYRLHCTLSLAPAHSQPSCAWVQRSVSDLAEEADLAIVDQADKTLEALAQCLAGPLQTVYAAQWNSSEEADAAFLQLAAESLPDYAAFAGREISWTEENGSRRLYCAVELQPLGSGVLAVWTSHGLVRLDGPESP